MKLVLSNDDGEVMEIWYIPDEENSPAWVKDKIERSIPTYDDRAQYEAFK